LKSSQSRPKNGKVMKFTCKKSKRWSSSYRLLERQLKILIIRKCIRKIMKKLIF